MTTHATENLTDRGAWWATVQGVPKGLRGAAERTFLPAGFLPAADSLWKSRTSQVALMMALCTCKLSNQSFPKAQAASQAFQTNDIFY